jgi:hypothetical protein
MAEEYTCIECEYLYDETDGNTDKRMCDQCLILIESEELEGEY